MNRYVIFGWILMVFCIVPFVTMTVPSLISSRLPLVVIIPSSCFIVAISMYIFEVLIKATKVEYDRLTKVLKDDKDAR